MKIPQVFMNLGDGQQAVMNVEAPIHYKDVRLVVPMPDPVTGDLKDTIVANITTSGVFHNRQTGEYEWTRYIAGTDTEISWPEKVEKEAFDMPGDTRIMDVEVVSYAPTLLEPPFPPSVMDELRNKYSKFRTRHDPEFLAKIKQEEEAENTRLNSRLRTPMQEFNKLRREALKARGPPVMTESILEQIGRVMAQNRPELLEKVKIQSQID